MMYDKDKTTDQPRADDVKGGGDFKPLPASSTSPGQTAGSGGEYMPVGPHYPGPWHR